MGVITFLLANKKLVGIGFLVLVLSGVVFYIEHLKSEIATAVAEKATVEAKLKISENSNATLKQSIDDQNSAIDKMKKDEKARFEANQGEINKAKTLAAGYKKQADDLMKRKAPANVDKCVSANDLINQEIQNAK